MKFAVLRRSFIQEKAAKIVYDVQFNQFPGPNQPNIFAAVAGNRVSLYQCEATPNGRIKLIDCYEDPDVSINQFAIGVNHELLA